MFKNFGRIWKETISKLGSCVGSWTILVRHIGVESRRPISSRAQIEAITQISDVRNEYRGSLVDCLGEGVCQDHVHEKYIGPFTIHRNSTFQTCVADDIWKVTTKAHPCPWVHPC